MRRPPRRRKRRPLCAMRDSVERVASSETPTRVSASMMLPENTQMSRPRPGSPRKLRRSDWGRSAGASSVLFGSYEATDRATPPNLQRNPVELLLENHDGDQPERAGCFNREDQKRKKLYALGPMSELDTPSIAFEPGDDIVSIIGRIARAAPSRVALIHRDETLSW